MMFDDRFSQCESIDDAHSLYEQLIKLTPLDSRHFLKRAINKRLEQLDDPVIDCVTQLRKIPDAPKDSKGALDDVLVYRKQRIMQKLVDEVMR